MNTQTTLPEVKLPVARMGMLAVLVCVLVAFAGGTIASNLDGAQAGSMRDGMMTLIATIPSVALSLIVLAALPARIPGSWGVPVLGVSMARSMMALMIGVAVYMLMDPSKVVFFLSLLAVLLIVLVIEVASVMFLVHEHAPEQSVIAAEGV